MQRRHIILFLLLVGISAVATIVTPVNHAILIKYHLSVTQDHVLDVLVLLPLYVIYAAGFYGYSAFQTYTSRIKRDKDGRAFQLVASGLGVLIIGSLVSSDISSVFSYFASSHLVVVQAQVMFGNYAGALIALVGLVLLYSGGVQLCRLTKKRFADSGNLLYSLAFLSGAAVFTYLFVSHLPANTHIPLTATTHAAYYSPAWALIPFFLVPYLISWYLGFLSIYLFRFYRKNIGAPIYAAPLRYVSYGLGIVISTSVLAQILTVFNGQLQNLSTSVLVVVIYILLLIVACGYFPIAIGARRLAAIEKV